LALLLERTTVTGFFVTPLNITTMVSYISLCPAEIATLRGPDPVIAPASSALPGKGFGPTGVFAITLTGHQPVILLGQQRGCRLHCDPRGKRLNNEILTALDEEIARLREARSLLAGSSIRIGGGNAGKIAAQPGMKRNLSADARRAIAEAQHRRWAKVKGQKKAGAPAKKTSAAG
jgi:hypothetical protein